MLISTLSTFCHLIFSTACEEGGIPCPILQPEELESDLARVIQLVRVQQDWTPGHLTLKLMLNT